VIFFIALVVYWITLCPTVYVGDSGELIAAAHTLGISHPTGYPLYVLLLKGFLVLVPFGEVAWRANLFSALCAAAAAQVLMQALRPIVRNRVALWALGLTLATLPAIWSQATVARTYALSALLSALLLLCQLRWWQQPDARWWYRHNLLFGFAMANHMMVLAHGASFLALVLLQRPRELLRWRPVLIAVLCLLPGLALYAYLPIRATADPGLEFHVPVQSAHGTELQDVSSWSNLRSYLARDLHHDHRWVTGPADYFRILGHHLLQSAREFSFVGAALVLLGGMVLWQRSRPFLIALVVLWVANLAPLAWHGAWWDIFLYPRYMTAGLLGFCVLLAFSYSFLEERLTAALRWLPLACLWLIPAISVGLNYRACDRSDHYLAEDYARTLLAEVPEGQQFASGADNALYPILYLHLVEQVRPDVQVVNEVQLRGKSDLQLASTAQEFQAREGRWPRSLFGPDSSAPYGHLRRFRHDLLQQWLPRDLPDPPRKPLAPLAIRGLEGDIALDAISVSVAAQIEADRADALFVRGQEEQGLLWLRRVADRDAPRAWGYWNATNRCFTQAVLALQRQQPEHAQEYLALSRRMLEKARTLGDPRSSDTLGYIRVQVGYEALLASFRLAPSDPGKALEQLKMAAERVPMNFWLQQFYVDRLRQTGRQADAIQHLERTLMQVPAPLQPRIQALLQSLK
jgi:hypothetical protein